MSRYLVTFFTPIAIGCGVTWVLMRDENRDITDFKKERPTSYKNYHENNEQIFKYIMESRKGDKIDFFAKEEELKHQQPSTTTATTTTPVVNNNITTPPSK